MKAHSERVPGKNLRLFLGKPLFFQVLRHLALCRYISKIIVNTDSARIAGLCACFPETQVLARPEALRGNDVPMNAIIAHDLAYADTEHLLQTHATNPLLCLATLEAAIGEYCRRLEECDSLFTVSPCRTRFYRQDGSPLNHNPHELLRTQDLPPLYEENSCLYIFSRSSFAAAGGRRIGLRPHMFAMRKIESIDIDYEDDFLLAEAWAKYQLERERHAALLQWHNMPGEGAGQAQASE
jgi:CMP-N-acetylneuraminic acid synthetase